MNFKEWNPELYLKFDKERTQPTIDLISRINYDRPEKIIDIGCGPGNSTQILTQRWPDAKITGIDNSVTMIEKAKADFPNQQWILMDAGADELESKYDIIFSNAAIQWIPNHETLLKKFYNSLEDNGLAAIQIPKFWDIPLGKIIAETAVNSRWEAVMTGISDLFTIHDYSYYYNQLSGLFSSIEMWETDYFHIMNSHQAILEMMRSTGLKPYLNRLESAVEKQKFESIVLMGMEKDYPPQQNGKVLFPFKRLFFIAYK